MKITVINNDKTSLQRTIVKKGMDFHFIDVNGKTQSAISTDTYAEAIKLYLEYNTHIIGMYIDESNL